MTALRVIAIDGPAGSGKSTVARAVATALGYVYVDTGAIYRCVALAAQRRGIGFDQGPALAALAAGLAIEFRDDSGGQQVFLDDNDASTGIRAPEISMAASTISAHAPVRAALLELQRRLALGGAGAVLEGRDIGTVVFPDAGLKVYLSASVEQRAQRRFLELQQRGERCELAAVIDDLRARDQRDETRQAAPLRCAADAVAVDSTGLTVAQVVARIVDLARQRLD